MGKRILVIDDEASVRKAFELVLEDSPYEVHCAENGMVAIDMLKNAPYDLIYLDLKMPVMNGVETLFEIRKLDSKVPVYIVTAFHREFLDQLTEARRQKLDFELLTKPIGRDQILAVTRSIL